MSEKDENITRRAKGSPDIKPELDDDWFDEADAYVGNKLVRPGRPKSENPKQPISIRLDRDVIAWFKSKGDGWQTRINDELRKLAGL